MAKACLDELVEYSRKLGVDVGSRRQERIEVVRVMAAISTRSCHVVSALDAQTTEASRSPKDQTRLMGTGAINWKAEKAWCGIDCFASGNRQVRHSSFFSPWLFHPPRDHFLHCCN